MNNDNEEYDLFKDKRLKKISIWFLSIGLLCIILLPFFFTWNYISIVDYTKTGQIGETINGIVGPFIALGAAFLTFLAFYIQYIANQQQVKQFKKQADSILIDRAETRLFESIKIHRENVSEIRLTENIQGRDCFFHLFKELSFIHKFIKTKNSNYKKRVSLEKEYDFSYRVFFYGILNYDEEKSQFIFIDYDADFVSFMRNECNELLNSNKSHDSNTISFTDYLNRIERYNENHKPFYGHSSQLGLYYRHLFQTIKYIDNLQRVKFEVKYSYAKTIRAQLSDYEQLFLYFNSLSSLGKPWRENRYIQEYKIIKNMPLPLADIYSQPEIEFKDEIEKGRATGDTFFEWLK